MSIDVWHFKQYVDDIAQRYGLGAHPEHDQIYEFYEAEEVPLFKLIFGPSDKSDNQNVVIVTFILGLDPVDAIQWFLRVRNVIPEVRLQASYFKDDNGETFLGEHAEIIKMYKDEQKVLSDYINSKQDEEEAKAYVRGRVEGRVRDKTKAFNDMEEAAIEFNRMLIPDKDELQ